MNGHHSISHLTQLITRFCDYVSTDLKNNQQQQHQSEVSKSGSSTSTDRPVYLGHTSLLATGSTGIPAVKTEPRSCDGVVGQPYSSYYQHPHQLATTSEHQQQSYYATQETPYHHQHHVTTTAKLLASS